MSVMQRLLDREHEAIRTMHQQEALAGRLACFVEPRGPGLNHFFVLHLHGVDWIGRKQLQQNAQDRWICSSLIQPEMLLGPLKKVQIGNQGARVQFLAVSAARKREALAQARQDLSSYLYFPLPSLDDDGCEQLCSSQDWICDDALARRLDADETHFREYSVTLLESWLKPGAVFHDVACSTGTYIAHLAARFPHCTFVGSDRSPSMIDYARARHAEHAIDFQVMDAEHSDIACDVLILRFLNAEVTTRLHAEWLFRRLAANVRPDGLLILFGHTPVLVDVHYLAQELGFTLIRCLGTRSGHSELFEFYVLQAPNRQVGAPESATADHERFVANDSPRL